MTFDRTVPLKPIDPAALKKAQEEKKAEEKKAEQPPKAPPPAQAKAVEPPPKAELSLADDSLPAIDFTPPPPKAEPPKPPAPAQKAEPPKPALNPDTSQRIAKPDLSQRMAQPDLSQRMAKPDLSQRIEPTLKTEPAPRLEPSLKADTAAEAWLGLLATRGVEYLFANGGTDFAPVAEAYAKSQKAGGRLPKVVITPHENLGVAMAHGYAMVTGRPQAMMVHVGVGTANALNGLINASRQNVPILFTAGRTPLTESGAVT
ncbi:MAG TPA: thiamine pyrophosphate-binding protein, partial [Burkholderiales bacterium]|nr:thiamine pyrophosphate-binding protein [Burkholderiales bacterium]